MSKTKKKKKHRLFWHFFRIQLALLVLVLGAAAYYFYGGYGKQVEELRQEAVRLVRQSDVNTFKANQTTGAVHIYLQCTEMFYNKKVLVKSSVYPYLLSLKYSLII